MHLRADLRITVDKLALDGDCVVGHGLISATNTGSLFGARSPESATRLPIRLEIQTRNVRTYLGRSLRPGLTVKQAAERYSALLSPELHHLLTVEHRWTARRHASWVTDLLDAHGLQGGPMKIGVHEDWLLSMSRC